LSKERFSKPERLPSNRMGHPPHFQKITSKLKRWKCESRIVITRLQRCLFLLSVLVGRCPTLI